MSNVSNEGQHWLATIIVGIVALLVVLWILAALSGLIIPLITWILAGTIAGRLLRGRGYGILGDIGLGIVGGIVGNIVLGVVGFGGLGSVPLFGGIVVGVIGAIVFVYAVRLFKDAEFAA